MKSLLYTSVASVERVMQTELCSCQMSLHSSLVSHSYWWSPTLSDQWLKYIESFSSPMHFCIYSRLHYTHLSKYGCFKTNQKNKYRLPQFTNLNMPMNRFTSTTCVIPHLIHTSVKKECDGLHILGLVTSKVGPGLRRLLRPEKPDKLIISVMDCKESQIWTSSPSLPFKPLEW